MDEELNAAIAASLQQYAVEQEGNKNKGKEEFPTLHELRHCDKSIFALNPLALCPLCLVAVPEDDTEVREGEGEGEGEKTQKEGKSEEDNRKRSAFEAKIAKSTGRSIVIKPTVGSWQRYSPSILLHCGITDSAGLVYNFDERGVSAEQWGQCISVPVPFEALSDQEWDTQLSRHHRDEVSFISFRPYEQLRNNCYAFVIRFLNQIQFEQRHDHSPDDIVARFIQAPIDHYEGYHNIRKELKGKEYYVADTSRAPPTAQRHICDICGVVISWGSDRYRCTECAEFDLCSDCQHKETDSHKRAHPLFKLKEEAVRYNCDVCAHHIVGPRHHCLVCRDYDLCTDCFKARKVNNDHTLHHKTITL